MLKKRSVQGIIDLKKLGFTPAEIAEQLRQKGAKVPSMPTIRKYFNMSDPPEDMSQHLAKEKAFDQEPFRSAVLKILENNQENPNLHISSVYDCLMEIFVENGDYRNLPGNEQTLRNYIHYLKKADLVQLAGSQPRLYDRVFDTEPGDQMLLDFGEQKIENGYTIYFLCMLLRYSRLLLVMPQDHKFNSEEACRAIFRGFVRLGGRVKTLVIDQDSVFIADETYGEILETQLFGAFCQEQELKLYVCRKADPESKGPIENSVKYVKSSFFNARKLQDLNDVQRSLPGWVKRSNDRIHRATYCVPKAVFEAYEKTALRPLVPSVYENTPTSFQSYHLKDSPYLLYKTNYYSVPWELCSHSILYKVCTNGLFIYTEDQKLVCRHEICELKGKTVQLPEHKRPEAEAWLWYVEYMRKKWNCYDFQHFVNGVKKENPRYLKEQFKAISDFLDEKNPDRTFTASVLKACCEGFRYRFSQFKEVFLRMQKGDPDLLQNTVPDVQKQDLSVYRDAFEARCGKM